jgi:hypothetical protein
VDAQVSLLVSLLVGSPQGRTRRFRAVVMSKFPLPSRRPVGPTPGHCNGHNKHMH